MTPQEYSAFLDRKLATLNELLNRQSLVIQDVHRQYCNYLFGGDMGEKYSTKPTLAGGNVFGNVNKFGGTSYSFVTKSGAAKYFGSPGKRKSQTWVRAATPRGKRNLIVIEGGYAALRKADGRQAATVDLRRSGILERDVRSSLTRTNDGFVSGVRRDENVPKLEGAIARYGQKMAVPDAILQKMARDLGPITVTFLTL